MKNIWSQCNQSYNNSFFAIHRSLPSCILPRFFLHGKEFRVVVSSTEWFGTEFREFASIFVPRNGIPSCFLFRGMVRNETPRICVYVCSTERNSELYSLPWKGSERNCESLLLCLSHGTEFRVVFSSAEGFGTEFRVFLFRGTGGIPPEITICSVYSVFRGIIFLSEIPNPTYTVLLHYGGFCNNGTSKRCLDI
jgi:hypothetical protein